MTDGGRSSVNILLKAIIYKTLNVMPQEAKLFPLFSSSGSSHINCMSLSILVSLDRQMGPGPL